MVLALIQHKKTEKTYNCNDGSVQLNAQKFALKHSRYFFGLDTKKQAKICSLITKHVMRFAAGYWVAGCPSNVYEKQCSFVQD